ncbi:hypothetical protein CPT_Suzuki_038 [Stenotrophomonas phage Suzuki]|nr:hypothetical protein CPT_Suzuki_038 [Stenotrophomonas phage Suzuki]
MAKRILVCGLPGSGKTKFAIELAARLNAAHVNGDAVREAANNWDFTLEGRIEQAHRMRAVADTNTGLVVSDFVAPTPEVRAIFDADLTVFMNTRAESQYADTNEMFVPPENADYVTERWVENEEMDHVAEAIRFMIPQGLMIGRFQPWHAGHEALFDKILEKEGYVGIGVRFMPNGPDNPLDGTAVTRRIEEALQNRRGTYHVFPMPNVSGVYYGRDVGYNVEQIRLTEEIESISATAIRKRGGV